MSFPTSLPASRIEPASGAPVLRWGILGSGWIAERFIESVRAHTKQDIVAVGSRSKDRAEEFASRIGLRQSYGDYDELVAADDLDVIYVATPHNLHHEGATLGLFQCRLYLLLRDRCHKYRVSPTSDGGKDSRQKHRSRRQLRNTLLPPQFLNSSPKWMNTHR